MAAYKDWLPRDRVGQISMAKVWIDTLAVKKTAWGVPDDVVTTLASLYAVAKAILAKATSSERTAAITAECQRDFAALTAHMRFIKDRYFKSPPLKDEDYVTLMLKVPDSTKSRRPVPQAQKTAKIHRGGTAMLLLEYEYAEGTESLANPRSDVQIQVRYGILPPPGIPPAGTELTKVPTVPEELPIVFTTSRGRDMITFAPTDSGKNVYFQMHIDNSNKEYGPWCPMFHAVIP